MYRRFGSCVPFNLKGSETICDGIYRPGVDYVFNRFDKDGGMHPQLIRKFEIFSVVLHNYFDNSIPVCREPISRLLCHYYYPLCGLAKDFYPPTAVCPEQCRAITQLCPEEWAQVSEEFNNHVSPEGVPFIECNETGEHLAPLPHCCSDLPLNISGMVPTQECCSQNTG